MFDPTSDGRHWLWALAEVCGLLSDTSVTEPVSVSTSTTDAWSRTASACELGESEIASFVAYRFGLPLADTSRVEPGALRLSPASIARQRLVLPLRSDKKVIVVATSDPTAFDAEQDLRFVSGRFPTFEIAPPSVILEAIANHYGQPGAASNDTGSDEEAVPEVRVVDEDEGTGDLIDAEDIESGPVVKLTNLILNDAVAQKATDIHIQPCGNHGVIRFRVDGVLRRYLEVPFPVLVRVVSRVKILGRMDISDRIRPQDGRARIETGKRTYDLRMSTVPARSAEKAVIRILDPEGSSDLVGLGIQPNDLEALLRLVSHRNGIVAVTGPTGSGKTTTLYGALHRLTTPEVNVMTVEDPIEYELRGVTQIQVETKRGLTFSSALRSILRQDPDIILVGEIRDRETAEIAVQASLTGHLVLSTLHTNDAIGTIRRMTDLGLDATAICETLRGAVAQRLVRRLCNDCAEPIHGELSEREEELSRRFDVRPARRARGCDACSNQGFRGRMPILQIFFMTPELEEAIREKQSPSTLRRIAQSQNMRSLLDSARERVADGSTTLEEVERVLGDLSLSERSRKGAGSGSSCCIASPREPGADVDLASGGTRQGHDGQEAA